ncbi:MAG: hypothetical protein KF724_03385 [Phycisphaeraceae bacterium]|nr:hypothetical protein [Phycisphaeraceae bacterium]
MTRRVRVAADPALTAIIEVPATGDARLSLWRQGPSGVRLERMTSLVSSTLAHAVDESRAARVVALLAPGQARCRVCELPNADEAQLLSALTLQAESMQLGSVPPHRSAAAVIPRSEGADRCGVVVEWPPSEEPPALPGSLLSSRQLTFAGDVSALAALVTVPGVRGPLLLIDAERGVVSFAIATPRGIALRSARENLAEGGVDAIVRLVIETALHHGASGAEIESLAEAVRAAAAQANGAGFGCSPDDLTRLAAAIGGSVDPAWWRQHAIHAGAALAAAGPLAALTTLLAHEPGEEPNAVGRVLNRLADPRVLTGLIVAALLAIAFGPLVFAWGDYWVTRWRIRELGPDKLREVVKENDLRIALYRERAARTWPMSKILSDLACCTPEGIELDQLNIVQGESVSVRGRASRHDLLAPEEVVLRMERLMQDSRIFTRISKGWDAANQSGIMQFNLSAFVAAPTAPIAMSETQDWAKLTLADRRHPRARAATPTAPPPPATSPAPSNGASGQGAPLATASSDAPNDGSVPGSARHRSASAGEGDSAGSSPTQVTAANGTQEGANGAGEAVAVSSSERRAPPPAGGSRAEERGLATTGQPGASNERAGPRGPAAAPADVPPDPLTDEQIAAMTKEEALAAAGAVARARNNPAFNAETVARLRAEFDKLMAHVRSK